MNTSGGSQLMLKLIPGVKLLWWVAVLAGLGLVLGVVRLYDAAASMQEITASLSALWNFAWVLIVALVVIDFKLGRPRLSNAQRRMPGSFALHRPQNIVFSIVNESDWAVQLALDESLPSILSQPANTLSQLVPSQTQGNFEYVVQPLRRGAAALMPAYVTSQSRWGFWQYVERHGGVDEIKVYPDFSTISHASVFTAEQAMRTIGTHSARQKGDGMEFHQLREFRQGDTLKQVDWKATARTGSPISREYQEEKDQNIVFLLDCSRRMRAQEGDLSYFDYALNALLLNAYIALDKGDAVGVMAFSGQSAWLPPIKGKSSINVILNHLFDLQTSTQSSDYVDAAEQLLSRHRKRSLVVLITNVRDEDGADLRKALEILERRHLVMVVALREEILSNVDQLDLDVPKNTPLYAGAKQFIQSRKKMIAYLKASGIPIVDASHKTLHLQLLAEYLSLKRLGRI